MTFGEAVKSVLGKYATFTGRASRSEYWYFILFVVILDIVLNILDVGVLHTAMITAAGTQVGILSGIAGLVLLLPSLGVAVRRLHDVGRSGWWLLLGLTVIGGLVLLYWYVQPGTSGQNDYGPDPLA
jgi:uncharacterized membrane protein YhaH (DUF805 family)